MFLIGFVLLTLSQSATPPAPQDEINDAMAHAEALYNAARFGESMTLLMRIDDVLSTQPERLNDRVQTKLQLALSSVGLNDTARAQSFFMELYALNPDYALDGPQFSPKVMEVAAEARMEQTRTRCSAAQADARTDLDSGQTKALFDLIQSLGSNCSGLAAMRPDAAEAFYRVGIASYKRGEFSNALSNFETALMLSSEHRLAREYTDLIHSKLQLGQDRMFVQWQQDFDGHRFAAATEDYRQIMSANNAGNTTTTAYVRDEYRKALSVLIENWNRNCGNRDDATLSALRGQISDLLPEPSFGEDIRAQMVSCEQTKQPASAPPAPQPQMDADTPNTNNNTCLDMQSQLALTRLKTRIDPVIDGELRSILRRNPETVVRVKARISENGDVTVSGMPQGNPLLNSAIRNAIERWKFTPIRDQSGPRCVSTEIPLALKLGQ